MIWTYFLAWSLLKKKIILQSHCLITFWAKFTVKCEQETTLQHRIGLEYYFGEWYESGLSDLDINGDEEMEESIVHHFALQEKQMRRTVMIKLKVCLLRMIIINLVMKRVMSMRQLNIQPKI